MVALMIDLRSNFVVAALFVTWLAVALLVLIVGNLYIRLQRLEMAQPIPKAAQPYSHLLGKGLQDLFGEVVPPACVFLFLSANCKSCKRVLSDLPALVLKTPLAITWVDQPPLPPPLLPSGIILLDDGRKVSVALGIKVTPFALVTEEGKVVKASPINSSSSLGNLVNNHRETLRSVSVLTG